MVSAYALFVLFDGLLKIIMHSAVVNKYVLNTMQGSRLFISHRFVSRSVHCGRHETKRARIRTRIDLKTPGDV